MRTRSVRRRHEERGAVLIIVAAFIFVAVAMLAAVVDLGGQRQERKEVTLSTDAAALAGAGLADMEADYLLDRPRGTLVDCANVPVAERAENPYGFSNVEQAVDDYLLRNGESNPVDCKLARTDYKQGYIVVSADEIVDYSFGPALGVDSGSVSGLSVAAVEVNDGGGVRPIGICGRMEPLDGVSGYPSSFSLEELRAGITADVEGTPHTYGLDPSGYVLTDAVRKPYRARLPIDKVKGGACGDGTHAGSGNFGKLDFDIDATSTDCNTMGHFCHDYDEGYYDPIDEDVKGDTGNNWNNTATNESTAYLEDEVGRFWAPVYTNLYKDTGVSYFDIDYFVQLRMVDHCFDGGCKFDGATWFDFEVSRLVDYEEFVHPDNFEDFLTEDFNIQQAAICAVEDSTAAIAAGCPHVVTPVVEPPPASSIPERCEVTSVTPETRSLVHKSGNKLREQVDYLIVLADPLDCGTITVFANRGANPVPEADLVVDTANPVVATFAQDANHFSVGTYLIEVFSDGVEVDYSPSATLAITAS